MHPPAQVCADVYKTNRLVRVAWAGAPKKSPDDDGGSFALVRLFRVQDVGHLDNPVIPYDFWHVTMRPDQFGRPTTVRVSRGPIFNRKGGVAPDWDPLFWVPVYMANLKSFGIGNHIMYGSGIIPIIKEWMQPIRKRVLDSAKARGRELKEEAANLGREAADVIWHEASKTGQTSPLSTREERVAVEAQIDAKKSKVGLEEYYNPEVVMPGG